MWYVSSSFNTNSAMVVLADSWINKSYDEYDVIEGIREGKTVISYYNPDITKPRGLKFTNKNYRTIFDPKITGIYKFTIHNIFGKNKFVINNCY